MFVDEHERVTTLEQELFESASCVTLSDADNLTDLPTSIHGRDRLWHTENTGCDQDGRDYTMVLIDSDDGVGLFNEATVTFTDWPYAATISAAEHTELMYFIR